MVLRSFEALGLDPRRLCSAAGLSYVQLTDPDARLDRPSYSESYFPRYHYGWQQLRALRDDRYTYIDAPEPELYDLSEDPGETRNIFKAFSARAEPLRLALEALSKVGTQSPERRSLDPETLQRLAALGYVGNVIDVDPRAVLPDPAAELSAAWEGAVHEVFARQAERTPGALAVSDPAAFGAIAEQAKAALASTTA